MTKILNSNQARAVEAAIVSNSRKFYLEWECGPCVSARDNVITVLPDQDKGGREFYVTYDAFINAYTFLL